MSQEHKIADEKTPDSVAVLKMALKLMNLWQLQEEQKAALLGLSSAMLAGYREDTKVCLNSEGLERISHLFAIHKSLRTLFPHNRGLVYCWMTTKNTAFEGLQPVEVIQEKGLSGLLMVRAYIGRAEGLQEKSGAKEDDGRLEQTTRPSDRQVYGTDEIPADLREAIRASVAPSWTHVFNSELKR